MRFEDWVSRVGCRGGYDESEEGVSSVGMPALLARVVEEMEVLRNDFRFKPLEPAMTPARTLPRTRVLLY